MSSRQPNILLIFVDNQPASMMGCYGNEEIFTPHLDDLASRGVLFRNAFGLRQQNDLVTFGEMISQRVEVSLTRDLILVVGEQGLQVVR